MGRPTTLCRGHFNLSWLSISGAPKKSAFDQMGVKKTTIKGRCSKVFATLLEIGAFRVLLPRALCAIERNASQDHLGRSNSCETPTLLLCHDT